MNKYQGRSRGIFNRDGRRQIAQGETETPVHHVKHAALVTKIIYLYHQKRYSSVFRLIEKSCSSQLNFNNNYLLAKACRDQQTEIALALLEKKPEMAQNSDNYSPIQGSG